MTNQEIQPKLLKLYETVPNSNIILACVRRGEIEFLDELLKHGIDLYDVEEILNEGYDCSRSKRRKGVLERCIDKGNKTIKVVVQQGFIELDGKECWELIHVGKFSRR